MALRLQRRIAGVHQNESAHHEWFHPVADMPHTMPLSVVVVTADGLELHEAVPLYAARGGAPVPATGTGQWDQIHAIGAAGR